MLLDLPEELLHSVFEALSPAARDTLRYTCHTLAKLGRSHTGVAHEAAAARARVLDELRRWKDIDIPHNLPPRVILSATTERRFSAMGLLQRSIGGSLTSPPEFDYESISMLIEDIISRHFYTDDTDVETDEA